ncbi:hypothetical protein [Aquibacillus kalidii]|nr:hypothetical protein [Aquibacillus kalidii]
MDNQWQNPIKSEKDKKLVVGCLSWGIGITVGITILFIIFFVWFFGN